MITKQYFGTLENGCDVYSYNMMSASGMSVRICEFGGAIMELRVPDRMGRISDVVAGYDALYDYTSNKGYLGALVGRVGNRINRGVFYLDGKKYEIYQNNNGNSLHGGKVGFSHKVWSVEPKDGEEPSLVLTLVSPDGDENYPGTLTVTVTYTLLKTNALSIRYEATTDQKTILNLTNHAYFNLGGYASGKIFDHVLKMDCDAYIPTNENLIPTGEIRSVEGTPFDFREGKTIGRDFDIENNEDLKIAGGYDHCFCFTGGETKEPVLRVEAYDPNSGRCMQVYTNQPCIQFYSGNFMYQLHSPLKGGYPASVQSAFCLETQKMPDSINHPNFTDTVLNPGEKYDYTTVFQFSVK
ncbi:MAG: galactose mutarotase [Clostridia bacterium]|nr:galactose mutarotase [Clostridia bacterium]MBQ9807184.1 galactose mutarotase [Clostridia bacterium]